MAASEPVWLDEDRDAVAAYRADQAERCPGCGTREDEWGELVVDDEGRHVLRRHQVPPYEAVTRRCVACEATGRVHREVPDGELGVYVHLQRPPGRTPVTS